MKAKTYRKGDLVTDGDRELIFVEALNLSEVVAEDPLTGQKMTVKAGNIMPAKAKVFSGEQASPSVLLGESEWNRAEHKFNQGVRPLLDTGRSLAAIEKIAKQLGVHRATIYRWKNRFIASGLVSSLADKKRGPDLGTTRLDPRTERLVRKLVLARIKNPHKKFKELAQEITNECKRLKVRPPHKNTLRARFKQIREERNRRSEGLGDDQEHMRPGGHLETEFVIEIVQIDHTKLDIEIVDEITRQSIGRPWITLAIDVHSRCIVGVYISLDPPSANSVGLCLYRAFTSKQSWLESLGVKGTWVMHGLPGAVHADNAKEFRGKMLTRVCKQRDIDIHWRAIGKPKWGGHIERLMNVTAAEMKGLPGATFSNPKERDSHPTRKPAGVTLRELESIYVHWIVNIYHKKRHSALLRSPESAWEEGTVGPKGVGLPQTVSDEYLLRIELLPTFERTVDEYGVLKDGIHYYASVLRPYARAVIPGRHRIRKKITFHYDYRDISKIYFIDPDTKTPHEIPYRNRGYPSVSRWELRAARKRILDEEGSAVSEDKIFSAIQDMRAKAKASEHKSKAARRERERERQNKATAIKKPSPPSGGSEKMADPVSASDASETKVAPPNLYHGIEIE